MSKDVFDRFFEKVDAEGPCWLWTGAKMKNGYGVFNRGSGAGTALAHRFSYELLMGAVPEGAQLDHLCRVRNCVNPDHLEPVTQAENMRRGFGFVGLNSRKTHCPNNHPYDAVYTGRGKAERYCSKCQRVSPNARRYNSTPSAVARSPESDGRCKITPEQAQEIRELYAAGGITMAELGRRFSVGRWQVGRIVRNQSRKDTNDEVQ